MDKKRVAVIGHSEGGSVAMLAAAKDNRIAALALVATIGVTGADLNLYQVGHALDLANRPAAERQSTLDLQKKIQTAVLTGMGWEGIPPVVRRQAETPWFQSFLAFDPAKVMTGIDQPILIVQGERDTQVPPTNADTLAALANARKRAKPSDVVRIPGINHLLSLLPPRSGHAPSSPTNISPAVPPRSRRGSSKRSRPQIMWTEIPTDDAFTFRVAPGGIKTFGRAPRADFSSTFTRVAPALPCGSQR